MAHSKETLRILELLHAAANATAMSAPAAGMGQAAVAWRTLAEELGAQLRDGKPEDKKPG